MRGLVRFAFVVTAVFVLTSVCLASASNVYVAQNAAGAGNGADCADAYAVTFFNTAANWGTGAGQIGPGTTVHLCGTFTAAPGASNYLVTQSNGTSGNPITLLFESGAVLQAPYWSGPAIYVTNNYVTVNGGTNGLIQATANGSALTYQQPGGSCVSGVGASNFLVENLTCANIYVRTTMLASFTSCSTSDDYGTGVADSDGNNVQFTNITAHDMHWAVGYSVSGSETTSDIRIGPGNNIYNADHTVYVSLGLGGASGTISGVYVYGNHFHDFSNWDDTYDCDHHDAVHVFDFAGETITNVYVYNNLIDGNTGSTMNAGVYMESADESGTITSCGVFNNIFSPTAGTNASGAIADYTNNGCQDSNNDLVGGSLDQEFASSGGADIFNNIIEPKGGEYLSGGDGGKFSASDYNDFYPAPPAAGNNFTPPGGSCCIDTLAAWRTATSLDPNSITGNPSLASNFYPGIGSAVIAAGKNLYSVCNGQANPGLGALCYDKAGVARPSTGNWTMGAYTSSSVAGPTAPANLTASVQ